MYDMYPAPHQWGEWGPAHHRTETDALQTALDLRDNGGQRPDDN